MSEPFSHAEIEALAELDQLAERHGFSWLIGRRSEAMIGMNPVEVYVGQIAQGRLLYPNAYCQLNATGPRRLDVLRRLLEQIPEARKGYEEWEAAGFPEASEDQAA